VYANYVVTINGFPARERWVKGRAVDNSFDVSLQTGLVRGKNEVEVRLRPRLRRSGQELTVSGVNFTAEVLPYRDAPKAVSVMEENHVERAYARWSKQAKEEWKRVLEKSTSEAALDSIKIWAGSNPLTVSTTFDNEAGPDFSAIFEEAPVLEDTPATRERLKDYAMHLRNLMAEKDTSALFEEFRPSVMGRFRMRHFDSKSEYMAKNRKAMILEEAILNFDRSDVGLRPWSEGRVWELWRKDSENRAFFETSTGYGMGELYVAEIDGELRVVR
jgi:hypothetical protein